MQPDPQSMTDALRSDHEAIERELARPDAAATTSEGMDRREDLVMTLVRHFVAEDQTLYPAVRHHLAAGDAAADEGIAADRAIETSLRGLEDDGLTPDALAAAFDRLQQAFAEHVRRQEPQFATLESELSQDELDRLGEQVIGAEQVAPTRPRRVAAEPSEHPGIAGFVNFVEGFVDRTRDYYSRRGADPDPADPDLDQHPDHP